jgi:hypothetical protein
LATTEAVVSPVAKRTAQAGDRAGWAITGGLTAVPLAVAGYHPYAEDGGVYLAGVKRVLDPGLYPHWSGFVTAHLEFSLFAPVVAELTRCSHLGVMTVMLALYVFTTWLTLYAGWMLAKRCAASEIGRVGAVVLLALALTVPVAGTSLMLVDPYVTARSLSTPLGLMALAWALDAGAAIRRGGTPSLRTIGLCAVAILLAGLMHPLMAAYGLGCVLLAFAASLPDKRTRLLATGGLCACALPVAALCAWLSPAAGSAYAQVAHTRRYWFVGTWSWYEQFGLAGPLLVLALVAWAWRRQRNGEAWRALGGMSAAAGGTAVLVAVLFARWNAANFTVAKLQPLRIYQTIYAVMLIALGALLAEGVLKRSVARWTALVLAVGGGMAWVQARTFPDVAHLELPWEAPHNGWEQAFVWVREHTPSNAVVALDANYISAAGEDSENFRAIAERSALPDYSKDGGVASIAPALSGEWLMGERAQAGLDERVGAKALARLRGFGVSWFVVTATTHTSAECPYANPEIKVCRLR